MAQQLPERPNVSRKWVAKECRRVGHSVSTVQGSFVNLEPANDLTFGNKELSKRWYEDPVPSAPSENKLFRPIGARCRANLDAGVQAVKDTAAMTVRTSPVGPDSRR